ncbi:hypothetical protein ACFLTK_02015 [Chloroflexota bacterium]
MIDNLIAYAYTSSMDTADVDELFDRERVARKLTLYSTQYLQQMMEEYNKRDTLDPEHDVPTMTLLSLQEAVADVVVQNNRILWSAVQRLLAK